MKAPKVSIIVASAKNRGIGKDNELLVSIPEDLKRFKEITMGHPIIMGRKTFQSIGKPLPGRDNIIITRSKDFSAEGCIIASSLDDAIRKASYIDGSEVFIIGGGQIYNQAIEIADKIYLTEIDEELTADTFFPEYSRYNIVDSSEGKVFNGIKYKFLELERGKNA